MLHRLSTHRGLLITALLVPLILASGALVPPGSIHAASPSAAATPTPVPTASGGAPGDTTTPVDTSGNDPSLMQDETALLQSGLPASSTTVPLSTLPPVKGSVAALATQVIGLLSRVQASSLPTATKNTLLTELQNLIMSLGPALDTQDQVDTLKSDENVLLQARVDGEAAIDKLTAQLRLNLDKLRVDLQTTVDAVVVASVKSLTVTVSGGADTIQAQLGARVNRLLVNLLTDIDVLHIATLHATANVDTARLDVTLSALVKKLTLDLHLLVANLRVAVKADVAATVTAEAALTASLAAEIDGLRAGLAANVDAKLGGLDALLTTLINSLNSTLASTTSSLQRIQARVH